MSNLDGPVQGLELTHEAPRWRLVGGLAPAPHRWSRSAVDMMPHHQAKYHSELPPVVRGLLDVFLIFFHYAEQLEYVEVAYLGH